MIRLQNIGWTEFDDTDRVYIDRAYARELGDHRVIAGDLLIAGLGDDRHPVGRACVAPPDIEEAMVKADCFRFRLDPRRVEPRFAAYQVSATAMAAAGSLATGATRARMNLTATAARKVALPSLDEQHAVARFLDRETAGIDALVRKKEELIELLKEKRAALITRTVTKGLDPNVPMKDSGVEWLGEIPAHWDVDRIKWAAQMVSGHTPDKKIDSYWQGGDIPWVSLADTGQLREVDYIATTAVMTTSEGIAHSSAHVLPAGTVVFSRDATIGLCAITRGGLAVSQHFIGWVCRSQLMPEYLLFVLRSMTQELERLTMGATVRTIGMPDVKNLVTPIPPLAEQREMVCEVLDGRARVDALIAKVRDAIGRLKELRSALISAAVMGKIDVREQTVHTNEVVGNRER